MFKFSREERNVLYVLLRMNFKRSDYKSILGVFWSFLGPALTFLITYLIFEDRFGRQIAYFPLRLLTGIICLGFFSTCVTHTIQFLNNHKDNLLNSNIPSQIYLLTSLYIPSLKFCTEQSLCLLISIILGVFHIQNVLTILILVPAFFFLAAGVGLILCVTNCFAGDVSEIWSVISRMLIFLTPTFYTIDMLSSWAGAIIRYLNPVSPFVISFQHAFTNSHIPGYHGVWTVLQCIAYSSALFLIGYFYLKKFEKQLVERL